MKVAPQHESDFAQRACHLVPLLHLCKQRLLAIAQAISAVSHPIPILHLHCYLNSTSLASSASPTVDSSSDKETALILRKKILSEGSFEE
ncbi:hypothetical protein M378DRAFT_166737 [Amanita muscaria Koide BX008]|uniref:Uncharacterized protein n=1 Tax=Amanita muscaria (strain Koide BX008) TaxID=946122 RepID=A0A0C2WJB6_AMAMK|nr:hypothetical protein M378DRAFT_166737 [Amanita muscaria Koide BX008]